MLAESLALSAVLFTIGVIGVVTIGSGVLVAVRMPETLRKVV